MFVTLELLDTGSEDILAVYPASWTSFLGSGDGKHVYRREPCFSLIAANRMNHVNVSRMAENEKRYGKMPDFLMVRVQKTPQLFSSRH